MNKRDIACPRATSMMSPCIVRDGRVALADEPMVCVMCGVSPRQVVVEFADRGVSGPAMAAANRERRPTRSAVNRLADKLADLAITYIEGAPDA